MWKAWAGVCCVLSWAVVSIQEDGVPILDEQTFAEAIKNNQFVMVQFFAPWCGHCKQFAPEYAAAAKVLKQAKPTSILLAKVDVTAEVKLAEEYNVRGYPTIKLFIDGHDQEYTGGRTEQSIITWTTKKVGPAATDLDDVNAADAFEKAHPLMVLGFFEDSTQRASFDVVARQIEDVYFAYSSAPAVFSKYGVSAPAVRMFFPHDEQTADFQGDLAKVVELETFVKAHRQPLVTKFSGETAVDVFNDGRPILFLFRNDDDAGEKAEKALREVAPRLKRRLLTSVAGANEPMDQRLMDYIAVAPEEVPTVRLVTDPTASMSKYKLEGEITTSSLTNFVADFEGGKLKVFLKSEEVPKSQTGPVYKLVGSTFDAVVTDSSKDVLVEFYAPWCGHCKKLEPVYRDVAKKLEGVSTLVIANMDVTANDVAGLDVEGFPTIKLWRADKKDDPIDYDSDRDVDSFINWLEDKVSFAFSHADIKTEL